MLRITGLTVAYGPQVAVADLDLTAADGEVVAVLGPSGCGKSTLLRAIAGLERPRAGRIHLDDRDVTALRPDRRDVGLMFQDHALFPHRSVAANVAFGPRMRGLDRHATAARVAEALALVDLADAGERPVTALSGGEQQRVALARAIAPRPRLLMLDEPLGSLDRVLRDRLLAELPRVFAAIGTTVLYVTHDQEEALALADRVAVMRAGRFVQQGDPATLWRAPDTEFVARFLGLDQLVDAEVLHGVGHSVLGALPLPNQADGPVRVVLLPDALRLAAGPTATAPADPTATALTSTTPLPDGVSGPIPLPGRVTGRRFAGDHVRLTVDTHAGPRLTVPVWRGAGPALGSDVEVLLDPRAVRVVAADQAGGRSDRGEAEPPAPVAST